MLHQVKTLEKYNDTIKQIEKALQDSDIKTVEDKLAVLSIIIEASCRYYYAFCYSSRFPGAHKTAAERLYQVADSIATIPIETKKDRA